MLCKTCIVTVGLCDMRLLALLLGVSLDLCMFTSAAQDVFFFILSSVALHCDAINETAILLSWAANGTRPYAVRFSVSGTVDTKSLIT
jgi:hypothetical protein